MKIYLIANFIILRSFPTITCKKYKPVDRCAISKTDTRFFDTKLLVL